jgi:hypothetical protein
MKTGAVSIDVFEQDSIRQTERKKKAGTLSTTAMVVLIPDTDGC